MRLTQPTDSLFIFLNNRQSINYANKVKNLNEIYKSGLKSNASS